ncbi:BamA/TamA family outer membrane protein [Chryseolinea sp. T2]|uniref:BamA/TamA family outer membrane protein n=1 Tax=Chryseolinea sp. T2 TaxID=3129255 RepID=UPI0030778957
MRGALATEITLKTNFASNIAIDTIKRPLRGRMPMDSTGHPLAVNRILIVGNRITKERIILRELTVKSGDVVNSAELPIIVDLDRKKLINTRLFNTVEIKVLDYANGTIDLLIEVNERWYTFPSPIFELADRNFNEWWQNYNHDFSRVNYGLRLYQFNMRGRNETLRLTAQFGFQRRFEISYRFPYIDRKQKQGLILDFDFAETKNLAYQTLDHKLDYLEAENLLRVTRGGGVTYTYRKSFYTSHSLRYEFRSTSINDTIALLNPNYLGDAHLEARYSTLSYSFSNDHRDYIGYPLTGHYLLAQFTQFGLTSSDDLHKTEGTVTFAKYINLGSNFYLSNSTTGYLSAQASVPYVVNGGIGYQRRIVRGYEIYVIEGQNYALNKLTVKKRIFSRVYNLNAMPIRQFRHLPLSVYIKTYGDLGYVKNYDNYEISSRMANKLLTGAGGGIDIVASYDAVLRLEYSFNGEGESGFFFHIKKEF